MRILHLSWGVAPTNGAANIARLIMREQQTAGHDVALRSAYSRAEIAACDELWCHCGWYWRIWLSVRLAKRLGKRVKWVTECCYDPMRLAYHGWKKRLAGPFERAALRKADALIATCPAEAEWIRAYLGTRCPRIEVTDITRFFTFLQPQKAVPTTAPLRVLYLGRPHPLKGTNYLLSAAKQLGSAVDLRLVSDHHGDELAHDWEWCDVLCLPTLSDNFALVVAEALSRGKRVITTDGAPAWEPFGAAHPDQLVYLRGFRAGNEEQRIALLRDALSRMGAHA